MPGFELWGDEERKEVNDVLETGILMRYGFDGPRKGIWKSIELEKAIIGSTPALPHVDENGQSEIIKKLSPLMGEFL